MERLLAQMEFIAEVDKLKNIGRQSYITNGERKKMTQNTLGIWL